MSLKNMRSMAYTICHAPEPMTSYTCYHRNYKFILMSVMSSRRHSAKALSIIIGYSFVAIVTGIWRHLTYNSREAWHTVYAMLALNYK